MKKFMGLTLALTAAFSLAAGMASAKSIGISVLTLQNPFFKVIVDNVTSEAAKSGYDVLAVSAEFDPGAQNNQVNDFIVKKVDAIILTPADSKAVAPAIKKATEAGIPVFTADIACMADDCGVVSHIATDNYAGGRQAGKAMHEALGGKGKVAIIDHPEVESVILRTKGFQDELKELNSGIEIVGSWPGKGSKDVSFSVAQEILQAHGDLNGFFCINDPSALGALAALEIAKKTDVKIVGFDGMPEGKQAIKDGKIFADPIQYPDKIGQITVQTIMQYFAGEKVEPQILIPTGLYYKADADKDPELQK
ncbi:monosaccharide-transporting ATPase [Candidatus Moduliflexus flocculans]|uniref:Monosaccharide-transporting ATPase n=1 Tax=Candidatus Moduliflexus flocculans TaxID=1499966 RepID=A0A0S6VQP9_9BACT|nr:monosaccharide-transporting ATPase [Candidatus Moduliflexus flocculans]